MITLAHSDSLWLTLALSLWLTLAHSGSLRRSSAHKVLARLTISWPRGHSLSRPASSRWYFSLASRSKFQLEPPTQFCPTHWCFQSVRSHLYFKFQLYVWKCWGWESFADIISSQDPEPGDDDDDEKKKEKKKEGEKKERKKEVDNNKIQWEWAPWEMQSNAK